MLNLARKELKQRSLVLKLRHYCRNTNFKVLVCMEQQFAACTESIRSRLPENAFLIASDDVKKEITDADVAIPYMTKLSEEVLKCGERIKLVQQFGVGLEGVDLEYATRKGIAVCNIPALGTGNDISVAEHMLYLLFSILRNSSSLQRSFKNKLLGVPLGDTLEGKKVVVLGFGNVGRLLTLKLKALGCSVTVIKRTAWEEEEKKLVDDYYYVGDDRELLHETLKATTIKSDILILACPLTEQTKEIVDISILNKKGLYLINVARGAVVKMEDLQAAQESGSLAGIGLDVFWTEPFDPAHPIVDDNKYNIVGTGHVGGHTKLANSLMSDAVCENIRAIINGRLDLLKHCVNFEQVVMKRPTNSACKI